MNRSDFYTYKDANENIIIVSRQGKSPEQSVCRVCGHKFYSKTTNYQGSIICPNCDKGFNKQLREAKKEEYGRDYEEGC